ncbi:MAG: Flp pilus assembly complex ATPase component TadA [Planctomycetes bacterium]|nr:Flp pilus assembly complex ATPase component TadA [Planctomycetota bacterium]
MPPKSEISRDPLGRVLVKKGFITAEQLEAALARQKETREKIGKTLLSLGFLSGSQLLSALAAQNRLEFIKVGDIFVDPRVVEDVPRVFAQKNGVLPILRLGDTLFVGIRDGHEFDARAFGTLLNCKVEAIPLGAEADIDGAIQEAYGTQRSRKTRDSKIGQYLVAERLITEHELERALELHDKTGERLGEAIVSLGLLSTARFHEALAAHLGLPFVTLDQVRKAIRGDVAKLVPRPFAEHNLVFPFSRDEDKVGVMATGAVEKWLKDLILTNARCRKLDVYLATEEDIRGAIREAYDVLPTRAEVIEEPADTTYDPHAEVNPTLDAAVPKLINELLFSALNRRASDIHIEQYDASVVVRMRVDGHLRPVQDVPIDRGNVRRVLSRIKVDCKLDIAERRKPQDGSFSRRFAGSAHPVDFRVAIQPTLHGENVTLRILDRARTLPALDAIGFQPDILRKYRRMIENPQGMILFTGPTGSGKTTSLYATLDVLRHEPIKILTAEDPIEYSFPGIQQCQVQEQIGNTFARYLRGFLRQDPDVILVGEIRDPETAEFGVRAALTGHLVFSTLHTNDTVSTVRRLVSLKVDPDLVASSLLCVVSQRLARSVCRSCAHDYTPKREAWAEFYPQGLPEKGRFRFGKGCEACDYTGYHGRVPIFEFWEIDGAAKELIQRVANEDEMREAAVQSGMASLVQDGLWKAEQGLTTLNELRESIPYFQIQDHRQRAIEKIRKDPIRGRGEVAAG